MVSIFPNVIIFNTKNCVRDDQTTIIPQRTNHLAIGAGKGNRTPRLTLGRSRITTILYPLENQYLCLLYVTNTHPGKQYENLLTTIAAT